MTRVIDMKFGLLFFLLIILSIISSITTDGLFRQALINGDDTLGKLRHKTANSKYISNIYTYFLLSI